MELIHCLVSRPGRVIRLYGTAAHLNDDGPLHHIDRSVEKAQESAEDKVIIYQEEDVDNATQQCRDYGQRICHAPGGRCERRGSRPLLGSVLASQIAVAFICAFIGAVLALVIGNAILGRDAQFAIPSGVMIWNVIIALWLGALAGHELSVDLRDPPATPLVGALSGVLAAVLIGSFVITIYTLRNRLSVPKS